MKNRKEKTIYKGDIVAGSLLLNESRKIAQLLLKGVDAEKWNHAIVVENVLQKRSPVAAKRHARLIKSRLVLMNSDLWGLVGNRRNDIAIQALMAAAIKHSRLLGDFMDQVVHENWRTFKPEISPKDWVVFLETCSQIDSKILGWSNATRSKLRQIIIRILAEAGYIDSTKRGKIQPVSVLPEIEDYLVKNSEDYVLHCMQATP